MEKNRVSEMEKQIAEMLGSKKKSFLTLSQVKTAMPAEMFRQFGISKKNARPSDVLKMLESCMGEHLKLYKGSRSFYVGFRMSPEQMISEKIRKTPGISPKNLFRQLPLMKGEYLPALNRLLSTESVLCSFSENWNAGLTCKSAPEENRTDTEICKFQPENLPSAAQSRSQMQIPAENAKDARAAFKAAYDHMGKGRGFVRIHRIREYLGWDRKKFQHVLDTLLADYTVEIHRGDPSILTDQEIRDSHSDENGTLYITLSWWGESAHD